VQTTRGRVLALDLKRLDCEGKAMGQIDVRAAEKADIRELSRTLGRAFHDDPVMTWMFPDSKSRAKTLPRLFATLMRYHHLATAASEVARNGTEIGAAALWDPPGRWRHSRLEELRAMPAIIVTLRQRASTALQVVETMQRVHPEEPHWYLAIIGSDPSVRGGGYGHALMSSRLNRVDAEHAPAYLESSNPDNVPYYMRFGFEVTGEIQLPNGGPRMWPMWRAPR
jgi:GNAT superfamily N-acetyltransferase